MGAAELWELAERSRGPRLEAPRRRFRRLRGCRSWRGLCLCRGRFGHAVGMETEGGGFEGEAGGGGAGVVEAVGVGLVAVGEGLLGDVRG